MKIQFDNVSQFGTGPGTFASRLAKGLFDRGHEVVTSNEGAEISLVFIERSGAPLASKVVQRLDGFWFKPAEFTVKNVGIRSLYATADAVVFQSKFDKDMALKHFGDRTRGVDAIINNGIDTTPVKEVTIPALADLRRRYDRVYVCSSNWHPQKRLSANVDLYKQLAGSRNDSCLIIMGNNPDVHVADPHVFYTGHTPPDVYNQVYSVANWMIHLAWADHCPNVVVEALAQGTPVVCSSVGGTKELVGGYGHVIHEDYDLSLADYDNPPVIDLSSVTDLPDRRMLDYSSISDIDIRTIVGRYVRLFETLTSD